MAISYLGTSLKPGLRRGMRKIIPYGIGLMAVVLILRGMNPGIPFISPEPVLGSIAVFAGCFTSNIRLSRPQPKGIIPEVKYRLSVFRCNQMISQLAIV